MKTVLLHDHPLSGDSDGGVRPAVALSGVRKVYGKGEGAVVALDGVSVTLPARLVHRDHGAVRIGQEHVPARRRRPRPARPRHRHARRHRTDAAQRAAADDPAPQADRLRLPGVQPDAVADGRPEHRPAAAARRAPAEAVGRAARSRRASGSPTGCATGRGSSPAGSSSASRSPARCRAARGRLRRRADGRARHAQRPRRARAAARARRPRRPDGRHGHPRPDGRHVRRPRDPARRRPDRRTLDGATADEVAERLAHLGD